MSSWARPATGAGGEGRAASILGKIPGYTGYKNKESRRDEDKRLREELARQYGQFTQRLSDLQGELVRDRRLMEIGTVERLERSLRLFTDRLRTASYGYGGLFSERSIDEQALDQLHAFDQALGDGLERVGAGVTALESAARGGDLKEPARALQTTIDELSRRFDLRGQVMESGQAQAGPDVDAVFTPAKSEQAHVASELHFGDAVSIAAADYLVQGRAEYHTADTAWRVYLLRDGQREQWLHVPPTTAEPMALLDRIGEAVTDGEQITVGGTTYTRTAAGSATAELVGESGKQSGRAVQYRRYEGPSGSLLFIYDWGKEQQAYAGRTLDPLEVNVYAKP